MFLSIIFTIIALTAVLNFFLLIIMVFSEKRKPENIIAWLTILTFLPIIGFVLYVIFGSGLSVQTRRMIKKKGISERDIIKNIKGIQTLGEAKLDGILKDDFELVSLCYNFGAYPLPGNNIKIFTSGKDYVYSLIKDLKNAKKSINMEYYIFANDKIGNEVMNILCEKAKQGVEVNFIFDSIGSRKTHRKFFKKLEKASGHVGEFFPPLVRHVNMKLNYRNHRKIVIIDGEIAYTGGTNIRDDHMGLHKRLIPWRDTNVRIEGSGAYGLQNIFLDDWRYSKNDSTPPAIYLDNGFFPSPKIMGNATVQILSSGPHSHVQKIKEALVKMILNAKESVYLQTPYFIPDDVFLAALRIAVKSGVDVRIMVPQIPDKKTVYLATLSYLKEMADLDIKIYLYNGFLHSKTMLVDGNKLSVGTCNTDNRSFALNFEDCAIIYSKELNDQYKNIFEQDMKNSLLVGKEYFKKKRWITKMLQAIMRLMSSLL